ncbi:MAG: hypothetical protein H7Z72_14605 [Bacteroidetes bacterium]|nr:hypothetical protein [Fibrella sp.]
MVAFSAPRHVVMACHITGVYDVNRNNTLLGDDYSLVSDWADSVAALQLQGVIFHNNFTEATCAARQNQHLTFVRVDYDTRFNPNVYRYFVYRDFLRAQAEQLESLFVTDVSDVVALQNPFVQPLFRANPNTLFCGDEPTRLANDWMQAHATHLRRQIADYADYEEAFGQRTLLNCGIFGGNMVVMVPFIEKLCFIHQHYNSDNQTAYTGDMGAFNYLARTQFNERLRHGSPVNTVFKAYQHDRSDCWFRHK